MFRTKYSDGVKNAREAQKPVAELPPFDPERLRSKGLLAGLLSRVLENPRGWLALLRRFWPTVVIGRIALVTKAADVRDILERQEFETPFGRDMAEMAGGVNFILGMQDGSDYRRMKSVILSAFPPVEVEARVRPIARLHSRALARTAMPGFNAIELLKIVPVRICRDYFGLAFDNDEEFADWSIALSSQLFFNPFEKAATRELASVAAYRMRDVINQSIETVLAGSKTDKPLARLVAIHEAGRLSLDDIRSIMMGMVSSFAPTNLLAGGNALDVVLNRTDARKAVQDAIDSGNDAALDKAILEAMRFKPIYLGPLRYVARDAVIASGTRREKTLRAGTIVIPSILSAMFDKDAVIDPERFDTSRPGRDYLLYGHGLHLCIGAEVARVQIAESFRALFAKAGLQRAAGSIGRLTRRGTYPERLCVEFDVADAWKTSLDLSQYDPSISSLCELIIRFLIARSSTHSDRISLSRLCGITGKRAPDVDLMTAITILTQSRQPVLSVAYYSIDKYGRFEKVNRKDINTESFIDDIDKQPLMFKDTFPIFYASDEFRKVNIGVKRT
ncbi:cytochrome P450 [Mesorhizobium opportunistum]|uniref:Cytochrome P450 n=1 Tax=Mesorhizobium opportunistum (strain LMG 24607 / HAMBI 3007 / WSM2075) TaxID=536019 RepID=F7YAU3_MESOW|nr:cytochrome P450 [Mesorhizobium opportunistum]AEH89919.1 Cytochrome P450 [Mesorhizobium opportunistum WSM2075]